MSVVSGRRVIYPIGLFRFTFIIEILKWWRILRAHVPGVRCGQMMEHFSMNGWSDWAYIWLRYPCNNQQLNGFDLHAVGSQNAGQSDGISFVSFMRLYNSRIYVSCRHVPPTMRTQRLLLTDLWLFLEYQFDWFFSIVAGRCVLIRQRALSLQYKLIGRIKYAMRDIHLRATGENVDCFDSSIPLHGPIDKEVQWEHSPSEPQNRLPAIANGNDKCNRNFHAVYAVSTPTACHCAAYAHRTRARIAPVVKWTAISTR